jgi:hypothetical protein
MTLPRAAIVRDHLVLLCQVYMVAVARPQTLR